MPFEKGKEKTGGRTEGTPNKFTTDIKAMVQEALDRKGGIDYLIEQADSNPVAFLGLVGKTIPKEVKQEIVNRVKITMISAPPEKVGVILDQAPELISNDQ